MKIKTKNLSLEKVLELPERSLKKPLKPGIFWRLLIKTLAKKDLKETNFTYKTIGMDKLGKKEPCLILMNHSAFIDLEIAETIMYPRPLSIVCTSDGFVGKELLMRLIGCIPTNKFVTDITLVRNMRYAIQKLKSSILMYPEASYSFDGTATPLPDSLGKCAKLLGVPIIMIKTYGAFARDPLYNNLQIRKVNVSADVKYLLSPQEINELSVQEINARIEEEFSFDNFKWQQENKVLIKEPFRADFLNRVLFKCPSCKAEGKMIGKGIHITCGNCGKKHELTEDGFLKAENGEADFTSVPDWYKWERSEVRKELEEGTYKLDADVEIYVMKNMKAIYKVGSGHLHHDKDGFVLTGCDGKLNYTQKPKFSYSLYSDYYWYEIGDMICIGNMKILYYCFPKKEAGDIVAKTRIATEELYKISTQKDA